MLIEIWERLRGYHNWTPAKATVQSAALSRVGGAFAWQSICTISWRDQQHSEHTAAFKAFEESPLYQLCEGDTVGIRFNPANPSEFYLPGLMESQLTRTGRVALYGFMLVVLAIGAIVVVFAH